MLTVSPERQAERRATLATLKVDYQRHGNTQETIARAAGVNRTLVVNVFAGRDASRNVVETAQRLVADAEKRLAQTRARKRQANGDEE